jgi:hypothetical protein
MNSRRLIGAFPLLGRGQQSTTSFLERSGLVHDSKINSPMSALGQKRTSPHVRAMSALLPKADIPLHYLDVRYGPTADIRCFIRSPSGHPLAGRRECRETPLAHE